MPTLRQVLDAATVAYYDGERTRGTAWDRMPRVGGMLGLVRDGAGPDEGNADVRGAVAMLDGYIVQLARVRSALAHRWPDDRTPATTDAPPDKGGDDPCQPRTPPPSSRQRLPD